jgi:hypothetical protein
MKKLIAYEEKQNETLKLIYESKTAIFKLDDSKDEYKVKDLIGNKYDTILERYDHYKEFKNHLEDISEYTFNDLEKKALIHCYEISTKALSNLKKQIKMNQPRALRNMCNYCGINNPGTYDHYIPKSEHPEYSVYGPNLMLCCSECNSKKSDDWKDINNKRYFLNFYYDTTPNVQIVECIITIEDDDLKVEFQFIKNNVDFEYKNLSNSCIVENHYTRLNLLNRFRDSCNSYIDETINSLKAHKKLDKESIINFLIEEHKAIVETYGINHWKSIAIKGMIDSGGFITYCCT